MGGQGPHWWGVCGRLTPASSWAPTWLLSQFLHPQQNGAENMKNKSKIHKSRRRKFNRWRKVKKKSKQEAGNNLSSPLSRSMPRQSLSNHHQRSQSPSCFFFYLILHCWAKYRMVQNAPSASSGELSNVLSAPSLVSVGQSGKERKPRCGTSVQQ